MAIKPIGEFYFHNLSGEYEKACKSCKKQKRNKKIRETVPLASDSLACKPDQIIEPKSDQQGEGIHDISFELWETLYGRKLDDLEKLEIKTNLIDFANVILCEYKKGLGS